MNLNMTWTDLARASGGGLICGDPNELVSSISTDTRTLKPEDAFWALKGAHYDAHDFLSEEFAARSTGWIIESRRWKEGLKRPGHIIELANTQKGLQALAAAHRKRFEIPIVGITGSNGKTTTKEMLRCICARVGPSCANTGNLNNQLGLPLSLLELQAEHRYGIFEMGASHRGDIAELARIARPTIALLTNIGAAHLEFFGTLEETFRTKIEMIEHLPMDGVAVINIDDPFLASLEHRLRHRTVTYGANPRARISFQKNEFLIDRVKVRISLNSFGTLSLYNAAAAAAAAWAMGIDPETIRRGLEDYQPGAMRLERRIHSSGIDLLVDAYNANPSSMRAAIEGFCEEYASSRKVLVLGDMKELGERSAQFHSELGAWLATLPLAAVYLAGAEMKQTQQALLRAMPAFPYVYAAAPEEWLDALRGELLPGSVLFFKASRAMQFERFVENL